LLFPAQNQLEAALYKFQQSQKPTPISQACEFFPFNLFPKWLRRWLHPVKSGKEKHHTEPGLSW
jgi:hypothetical protein